MNSPVLNRLTSCLIFSRRKPALSYFSKLTGGLNKSPQEATGQWGSLLARTCDLLEMTYSYLVNQTKTEPFGVVIRAVGF